MRAFVVTNVAQDKGVTDTQGVTESMLPKTREPLV